ncbi:DUF2254 domain-containing protein [soil metagenome]
MITNVWERVRDSIFLVPASFITLLAAAGLVARFVDNSLGDDSAWLLSTTVDSARAVLSVVATATVTVAAIVFSVTAVVVQLATSQYSPRVTQGFLRQRNQQITIGLTVGTFVFALLALTSVRGSESTPQDTFDFSVTLAVVLAVASMLAIVSFIDQIMRSMRVDSVIRSLADETESAIRGLPDRVPIDGTVHDPTDKASRTNIAAPTSGWVRSIDVNRILAVLPGDTSARLEVRAGDFAIPGQMIFSVWPEIGEERSREITSAIDLGLTRTITADPAYGIRQLVDIALRALSPSLNDATTAADVVRHLSVPLKAVLLRDLPGRVLGDERGNRVYIGRALTHSDYILGALREIRLSATDQPFVLRALLETIGTLIDVVEAADHATRSSALYREADATIEAVRASPIPENDSADLLACAREIGLMSTN